MSMLGIVTPLNLSMSLDMTGNYNVACIILLVALALAVFAGLFAFKAGDKLLRESAVN